jgi:hypothetical protein
MRHSVAQLLNVSPTTLKVSDIRQMIHIASSVQHITLSCIFHFVPSDPIISSAPAPSALCVHGSSHTAKFDPSHAVQHTSEHAQATLNDVRSKRTKQLTRSRAMLGYEQKRYDVSCFLARYQVVLSLPIGQPYQCLIPTV